MGFIDKLIMIYIPIIFIVLFVAWILIFFVSAESSNNKIEECETDYIGCDVYKCKAEKAFFANQVRNYLLKYQNCLLEQQIGVW